MRPHRTQSPLRVVMDAGHTLKDIATRSGVSYDTLKSISSGRNKISLAVAQKIASQFPIVTIDFLLGVGEAPGNRLPDEYEDQSTAIQKAAVPMTPALFNEAALKALEQSAELMDYTLPSNAIMRNLIAHHTWLGQVAFRSETNAPFPWTAAGLKVIKGKVVFTAESKRLLSEDHQTAIREIFKMCQQWAFLSDRKVPKHTGETTDDPALIGERLNLFQYWSYLRSQYLPEVEMQARPDLMSAMEGLLLNAESQLVRKVAGPRGMVEIRNDSYLVAHEVMAFIRATREKYRIRPDFAFLRKRLDSQERSASDGLTYKPPRPQTTFKTKTAAAADAKSRKMFAAHFDAEKARTAAKAAAQANPEN